MHCKTIPFLIILFLIPACAQQNADDEITVSELRSKMESDSSLVILDVRNPSELEGPLGKIKGVINIPVQQLEVRLDELSDYKDKEIAVICRTGRRSSVATDILNKNGFNAFNVIGGMTEYRATE